VKWSTRPCTKKRDCPVKPVSVSKTMNFHWCREFCNKASQNSVCYLRNECITDSLLSTCLVIRKTALKFKRVCGSCALMFGVTTCLETRKHHVFDQNSGKCQGKSVVRINCPLPSSLQLRHCLIDECVWSGQCNIGRSAIKSWGNLESGHSVCCCTMAKLACIDL